MRRTGPGEGCREKEGRREKREIVDGRLLWMAQKGTNGVTLQPEVDR